MKIVIVGAGALGNYVGALLHAEGIDVTLYHYREDYVKQVQSEGLTIEQAGGKSAEYHPVITSDLSTVSDVDAVIICTKATQTKAAVEAAQSLIKEDTLIGSFQNGYGNLDIINDLVGNPGRILAITTAHNFAVKSPTHIVYFMGVGGVDIGPMDGPVTDKINELGQVMKKLKVPVKIHESGNEVVWNKILWNAVLNCTAAVTGLSVIEMGTKPDIEPILKGLGAEYFEVCKAMGISLWNPPDFIDKLLMMVRAAAGVKSLQSPRPSMLQDIEAGRITEVDYINGALVAMGEKYGVPTPCNKLMTHLVKVIESKAQN